MNAMFPRMVAKVLHQRLRSPGIEGFGHGARPRQEVGCTTPMSSEAASLFRVLVSKGHAELDGIAVYKLLALDETV